MKNWKTTLSGILAGVGVAAHALLNAAQTGIFDGKTGIHLVVAAGIVLLGLSSKDKNVTGGTVAQ